MPTYRRDQILRVNHPDLVMVAVAGQVAHPIGRANPYCIGHDGVPRVLPASGGIAPNQRIGDRCIGLAGDHIKPGVALLDFPATILQRLNIGDRIQI
jgi:hypothetical protein